MAISELAVGDIVIAYDESTGEVGEYVITDTISHVDETVILLTIDGETLTTTAEHPFYTVSGEWVNAGDLEIGEEIVSLEDGSGTVEWIAVGWNDSSGPAALLAHRRSWWHYHFFFNALHAAADQSASDCSAGCALNNRCRILPAFRNPFSGRSHLTRRCRLPYGRG